MARYVKQIIVVFWNFAQNYLLKWNFFTQGFRKKMTVTTVMSVYLLSQLFLIIIINNNNVIIIINLIIPSVSLQSCKKPRYN